MKLNAQVIQDAIPLLERGNFRRTVAACLGIDEDTFCIWFKKGEKHAKSANLKGTLYAQFWRAVVKAEGGATTRLVDLVDNAAKVDARHAEWMLSRRHPDLFARKDNVTVSGPEGGPIKIENVRDRVREKLEALLASRAQGAGDATGTDDGPKALGE